MGGKNPNIIGPECIAQALKEDAVIINRDYLSAAAVLWPAQYLCMYLFEGLL